jgi:mono/diheme cytochrome c family protein
LIQDMMDQPAIKPQGYDPAHPDQAGSRLPPEGAVAIDHPAYPYHNDPIGAEKQKNPLAGELTPPVLQQGLKRYETFCLPCHGPTGAGDGLVAEKMVLKPANLVGNPMIVEKSDAHYFHAITDGFGGMGSYGGQIASERDRWAIVNYVRSLQKLARAGEPSPGGAKDVSNSTGAAPKGAKNGKKTKR